MGHLSSTTCATCMGTFDPTAAAPNCGGGGSSSPNSAQSGWFGYTSRPYDKLSTATCSSVTNHLSGNIGVSSCAECLSRCDTTQGCDGVETNGSQCYLKGGCKGDLSADPWNLNSGGWSAYALR